MNNRSLLTRTQLHSVIKTFTRHFPENYADKAWDNTGLLINCSVDDTNVTVAQQQQSRRTPKVLLAVDLTRKVAHEAINNGCDMIIAYHPFIFPSWKYLDPERNTQHASAIELIQHGISVYSPHTAMDAAKGGINDWLSLGIVNNNFTMVERITSIEPVAAVPEDESIGYGRVVSLREPIDLQTLVQNVKTSLGIDYLQIALQSDENTDMSKYQIRKVALCAGSGSGVFKSLKSIDDIDVFYTGELSHHELLKFKEMGKICIMCNHSNTERGYLKNVLFDKLSNDGVDCIVSSVDEDPLRVV